MTIGAIISVAVGGLGLLVRALTRLRGLIVPLLRAYYDREITAARLALRACLDRGDLDGARACNQRVRDLGDARDRL